VWGGHPESNQLVDEHLTALEDLRSQPPVAGGHQHQLVAGTHDRCVRAEPATHDFPDWLVTWRLPGQEPVDQRVTQAVQSTEVVPDAAVRHSRPAFHRTHCNAGRAVIGEQRQAGVNESRGYRFLHVERILLAFFSMWRTSFTAATGKRIALAVVLSLVAIAAAPVLMGPAYQQLQPRLGPFTIFFVEVLYALFIDFPLAGLYVALATLWAGPPRNAARSALVFAATFFTLILLVIAAAPLNDVLAYWALADTFPPAVAAAQQALGPVTYGLLIFQFVVFDLTLCAAGGLVGFAITGRSLPSQTAPSTIQIAASALRNAQHTPETRRL